MNLRPLHRKELIKKLRLLGYKGPFVGGKHEYMIIPTGKKIIIPNVHSGKEIGVPLLQIILRQLGVNKDDFKDI